MPADDPVRFRTSRARARAVRSLVFMAFCFIVGASVAGSAVGYAIGAAALLFCAWAGAVMSIGRAPGDVEVGRDGIGTARWRLPWDGVAAVSVERLRFVGETLVIHPLRRSDLVEVRKSLLGGEPQLRIPQRTIELPLADVVQAIEQQSGRTFPRATLERSNEEEP